MSKFFIFHCARISWAFFIEMDSNKILNTVSMQFLNELLTNITTLLFASDSMVLHCLTKKKFGYN